MQKKRQAFYEPTEILRAVQNKVQATMKAGETIDYLTFVPDGEPTLDVNLGEEIRLLKPLGIPIAVISNASLIWQGEVRQGLREADWVSLKMDAVAEGVWRRIDRPHKGLDLTSILAGALDFAHSFQGELMTETMLVRGVNDTEAHISQVADFLSQLGPATAYLAISTRPPAEKWAQPPEEDTTNRAYQILNEKVDNVEYLIGYEGNAFASTGDARDDLLSITAVHPMREDAVGALLERAEADWTVVDQLVDQEQLIEAESGGHKFYLRSFSKRPRS
jgi:wyosine [tRNA(Phe)-imidazoG37] synthetase (radical SAM superfamily)